jgi:hypothetical protein
MLLIYDEAMMENQELYDFMFAHPDMVLSTLGPDGRPQSAVVGFGVTKQFELVIGTPEGTRKAGNIAKDGRIAAVIGCDGTKTVQYEGIARLLVGDDLDTYTEIYFAKNPEARAYKSNPSERYFVIAPTWIRFTDVSHYPWQSRVLEGTELTAAIQ